MIPADVALWLAIVCAVAAICLIIVGRVIGIRQRKKYRSDNIGLNITIDSRDFVTKDAEQTKAVFDGLERLVKSEKESEHGKQTDTKDAAYE